MKLILENVRCFAGRHEHEIRPLTLLVGENSAGKSTFLAMLSAVSNPIGFPARPRFNDPPYNLGNFNTIATKRGRKQDTGSFTIGFVSKGDSDSSEIQILARYASRSGHPDLQHFALYSSDLRLELELYRSNEDSTAELMVEKQGDRHIVNLAIDDELSRHEGVEIDYLLYSIASRSMHAHELGALQLIDQAVVRLQSVKPVGCFSLAPVRSKPRRFYDQSVNYDLPEGDYVPFLLDTVYNERSFGQASPIIKGLAQFGEDSGLLKSLSVARLGDKPLDPIQLYVSVDRTPINLADVGYGVSQALPVIVQSLSLSDDRRLLIQQPEVHLHPKAQAALGSFFADLVAADSGQFVIETHSDYIIDRVRQEVARGKLKSELVSILYFERNGSETTIHEIEIDNRGNITNAPATYREFFLQEELNLLTRAGK